jgi:rubredoxin
MSVLCVAVQHLVTNHLLDDQLRGVDTMPVLELTKSDRVCPKCQAIMALHRVVEIDRVEQQIPILYWYCPDCDYAIRQYANEFN